MVGARQAAGWYEYFMPGLKTYVHMYTFACLCSGVCALIFVSVALCDYVSVSAQHCVCAAHPFVSASCVCASVCLCARIFATIHVSVVVSVRLCNCLRLCSRVSLSVW